MPNRDAVHLGEKAARRLVVARCCEIAPGLTGAEFARIEATYDFEFADDHRAFLAVGLPVYSPPEEGEAWEQPWLDWRNGDEDGLRYRLDWPTREVLDDVENGWWNPPWGTRPIGDAEALRVVRRKLARAPKLVPVYAHRFLPSGYGTYGQQVLSVWGTDIISYGRDLAEYITNEFYERDDEADHWEPGKPIPFWSEFLH